MKQKEIILTSDNLIYNDDEIGSWSYSDGQLCYSHHAQMFWSYSVYVGPASDNLSGAVEIPSELTIEGKKYNVVGLNSFQGCRQMTSIVIPSSVMSAIGGIFSGCDSLESIVIDKSNKFLDSRDDCNAIILTEQNILVAGCKRTVIPDSVISIYDLAFQDCRGLETLFIPSNILSIGEDAFEGCTGLKSIIVSKNNKKYDSRQDCNAIVETESNTLIVGCSNTTIPSDVSVIGSNAFAGTSISSIEIPEGIVGIGFRSFYGCSNMKHIRLPNSLQCIDDSAFGHSGIISIHIPPSVTDIDNSAFIGCQYLHTIEVDSNNPVYDSRDNCNAIIISDSHKLICGCKNTVIPQSVISIGENAFAENTELDSISIPSGVQEIEPHAFWECKNLTNIRSFISNPDKCFVHISSFIEHGDNAVLSVPKGMVEAYKHSQGGWQLFSDIQEFDSDN